MNLKSNERLFRSHTPCSLLPTTIAISQTAFWSTVKILFIGRQHGNDKNTTYCEAHRTSSRSLKYTREIKSSTLYPDRHQAKNNTRIAQPQPILEIMLLPDVAQCHAGVGLDLKSGEVAFCSCPTINSCITLTEAPGHLDYQITAENPASPAISCRRLAL